jgi:hypothetical protein
MHTDIYLGNLKERNFLGDLDAALRKIRKWAIKKCRVAKDLTRLEGDLLAGSLNAVMNFPVP